MLFYGAWLFLMRDPENVATALAHRPIALTMLFGSYGAGSTPMGGGTVAVPSLGFAYGRPATLRRQVRFVNQ